MNGGTGHVIEYTGEAIRSLSMDGRMTVCNMSIEAGARAGMIAPDETTFEYMRGRQFAPQGADFDAAVERWRQLPTDPGAVYDKTVVIRCLRIGALRYLGHEPRYGGPCQRQRPGPWTPLKRRRNGKPQRGPFNTWTWLRVCRYRT